MEDARAMEISSGPEAGDPVAAEALVPLLDELLRLDRAQRAREEGEA